MSQNDKSQNDKSQNDRSQSDKSEKTSARVAAIASRALQNPGSLSPDDIKALAASVLSQSPDQSHQQSRNQSQQR